MADDQGFTRKSAPAPATTMEDWLAHPEKGFERQGSGGFTRKGESLGTPKDKASESTSHKPPSLLPDPLARLTGRQEWPEYTQLRSEARGQMSHGLEQLGTKGQRAAGAFNVAAGAYEFTLSPINAALRTIVGKPVEEVTRGVVKKEWPEFAASLALPVIGLAGSKPVQATADAIQRVLSPTTVSKTAGEAGGLIRSQSGTAARDTAITEDRIEPFHQIVNKLPDADRYQFIDYVERRSTGATLPAYMQTLQPIADVLRSEFEKRAAKIQAMPDWAHMQFIEDYFPHLFKDPQRATQQAANYSAAQAGKTGSGLSMRKRTLPTYSQGIGMGLEPITSNPLEATMMYIRSMDRFIANQEMLRIGEEQGHVAWIKPKVYGASGSPTHLQSKNVPDGWVPLKVPKDQDFQAYAPEDWARVYNNYVSMGMHANADAGRIYDAVRRGSNAITSLELSLSGFHAATMAQEAIISQAAKGLSEIIGGKPVRGLGSIVASPVAPFAGVYKGTKLQNVYLGRSIGTADYRQIAELLEKAGGRAVGKGHALDYDYSAAGNYWKSFKRGALKLEYQAARKEIASAPGSAKVWAGAKVFGKQIGRFMDTVAAPLFEYYIPLIKNAAFYDTMGSWLKMNPTATEEQQVRMATKIWDSIDNRFGEMVQDNIFWNKTLKQGAILGMRSYSWNMGTVREIAGGAISGAQSPRRLSMAAGEEYDPRAAYVIAMPIVAGTVAAVFQFLKTGKAPEGPHDLIGPRTGGTALGAGGRGRKEERAALPGYQKDVFGWYYDWQGEAINKLSTGARMPAQLATNQNWRGDPIFTPEVSAPQWMQEFFNYATETFGPISIRSLIQGQKKGSNISTGESMMGVRPARTPIQDPEGYEKMMKGIHRRAAIKKLKHEKRQERQYGGPVE